jgi:hypothetical protein
LTLTREQILAVPAGPEMDCLVAEKILGCHVVEGACACKRRGGILLPFADLQHGDPPISGMAPYSTEIADAWGIVTHLRNKTYPGEFIANDYYPDRISHHSEIQWVEKGGAQHDIEGWFVCFSQCQGGVRGELDSHAFAPTLPLAICRAALIGKMIEDATTDDGIRPVRLQDPVNSNPSQN